MTNGSASHLCATPFRCGDAMRAYEYFGSHRIKDKQVFRVWAPHAESVSVCGDFTDWSTDQLPMHNLGDGVWELCLSGVQVEDRARYKYFIRNGCRTLYKTDPYAVFCEDSPQKASVIYDIDGYRWRDEGWLAYRRKQGATDGMMQKPINLYRLHVGSWKRHADKSPYSYRELAADLVTYVKQMGYTHVGLMPLCEQSTDESGSCASVLYAAAADYGEPADLMALVDTMHEAGIGVVLDWDPTRFAAKAYGLSEFDGQTLYERATTDGGASCFDQTLGEVQSFLISNAFFWIEKFHVDGIRVISPTLSIELCKRLNTCAKREHPDVMMIAGERLIASESDAGFCMEEYADWQNGVTEVLGTATTALLPSSYDTLAHKRFFSFELPARNRERLAALRTAFTYLMTAPGKKQTFMGCEIGQIGERDRTGVVEWQLLEQEEHARLQLFVASLNHLYLKHPALWESDAELCDLENSPEDAQRGLLAYRRRDEAGDECTVLINLDDRDHDDYCLPIFECGCYRELINSDAAIYGGRDRVNREPLIAEQRGDGGAFLRLRIAPMSATVLRRIDGDR